ncbi:MAG TPA: LysE family transporter [Ideonella sp.]|uniref:LysE family translocator n=1 Tax=Ideonella sp. TaxID=1929293 RepID=UPI002C47C034|nr:LysE family transporter [Ideonella sp.]HSI48722.1 LysE family transporter [Ideonella sp.]
MDISLFGQAMLVGLSIAAPVGPIGLLTIQRTLDQGQAAGLATGLGAAAADACYGALGAFGVTLVIDWLVGARVPLALVGGAVLAWLAWRTWQAPVAERAASVPGAGSLLGAFAGTFVLTLSNPATILSFLAIFGALAGGSAKPASPGWMILGVGCGSALWWWLLTAGVGRLRQRFDARWRRRVNQASALLLGGFALWQWISLARWLLG